VWSEHGVASFSVKKITFQNLWPRIKSNSLLIKTARSAVSKNRAEQVVFILRHQPRHSENVTISSAFPGGFGDFFGG